MHRDELDPCPFAATGVRLEAVLQQDVAHRVLRDREAQLLQFPHDPAQAPAVLLGHLNDQLPDLLGLARPPHLGRPLAHRLRLAAGPPGERAGRHDRDQFLDLLAQRLAACDQAFPLGRRQIHPIGQLAPQNAILGLQVVDHLGQFGLGRPGQNHEQGVENPGHAAITQVLGSVEHDNVFEHRRGGPEFLATRNRPKCPGGRGPITARIEMDAGGASLQPSRVAHSHRHLATWPPQVAGLALSPAVNPIATSSSALSGLTARPP